MTSPNCERSCPTIAIYDRMIAAREHTHEAAQAEAAAMLDPALMDRLSLIAEADGYTSPRESLEKNVRSNALTTMDETGFELDSLRLRREFVTSTCQGTLSAVAMRGNVEITVTLCGSAAAPNDVDSPEATTVTRRLISE